MDELEAHNTKFPKRLWADAKEIADSRYETMTEVLRTGLVEYVERHRKPTSASKAPWPTQLPGTDLGRLRLSDEHAHLIAPGWDIDISRAGGELTIHLIPRDPQAGEPPMSSTPIVPLSMPADRLHPRQIKREGDRS